MRKLFAALGIAFLIMVGAPALASADIPGMTHNTPTMTHNAPGMTHNAPAMTHN